SRKWPFLNEVKAIREAFPASDKELDTFTEKAVLEIENAFQRVIKVPFACKNFENTFYAIDFAKAKAQSFGEILQVVAYTHTLSTIRQKALECLRLIQEVIIKYNSHNELYEACRSSRFNHGGQLEKIKAIEERLKMFEVEGAHLNQEERAFCLALKKEIKKLETEFLKNLDEDDTSVWILKGDLEGVSKKLIESFDKQGAFCRIPCDTNTYYAVMCFCENERTRKRVFLAYNKRSHQKNLPILHELIKKRTALAKMLGFPSYAHLDLSDQLLKKPEEVDRFLSLIEEAVRQSSEMEIKEVLAKLPGRYLGLNNKIKPWNMPYIYALGRGYACLEDDEELKKYFSLSQAFPKILTYLAWAFNINLTLRIESIWEGVNFLVEARDENHLLLGHIVYDLYPRKGKYGHALCLDVVPPLIIDSKRMPA
ncbi:MAG: M3 family metallopeptidase, partial [Parachlamydiaceae bacterium]